MSRYKSVGIVHYNLSTHDDGIVEGITFVPEDNWSVKHRGKSYAIFISNEPEALAIKYKPEKQRGIDLPIAADLTARALSALHAAKEQVRVEIEVEADGTSGLKLVGLTVPAK